MADHPARAFVIGWPISHSLSPHLHTYWLKHYGINGTYEKIAVEPSNLKEFLSNLQANGFIGGNVTLPHKENTFALITNTNRTAKMLGAVNTLWFEKDILNAGNTDSYGFTANLDECSPDWRKATSALVLGAGGASRAVVLALLDGGIQSVTIVNRTPKRAQVLAEQMGSRCEAKAWESLPKLLQHADLLTNTTSLGMSGQPQLNIDLSPLPASAIVCDIVYNPLCTTLLNQAKSLDLETVDGIGMLLHQAVPGFEKWFGQRPLVTPELRDHMLTRLNQGSS